MLYSSFEIHFVGDILEQFQHIFAIAAFRSGGQTQNELRVEVGENLLVGVGCRMVTFVHDQVVKICRRELFQILGDTLHRCKMTVWVISF